MKTTPEQKRLFVVGLVLGTVFGLALNLAPLVASRQVFNGEVFEFYGFPFVFYTFGGYTGFTNFILWAFATDVLFAACLAVGLAFGLRYSWCTEGVKVDNLDYEVKCPAS